MKHYASLFTLSAIAFALTGCAGQAVDNTPKIDVSVVQTNIRTGGYLLPDGNRVETRYTVADKSTVESKSEYDSWITGKLMGDGHQSEITRLDKSLIWQVNYGAENYLECPLSGCSSLSPLEQLGLGESSEDEADSYDPNGSESCPITVKKYDFTVTPKARARKINGFTADQYVARWELVTEDNRGKQDKHVVTMDYWMADVASNQALKSAYDFDQKYYNQVVAGTPLAQFFNANLAKVMDIFSAGKEKELRKLTAVGGKPVSTKLEWYADVKTCQEPETAKQKAGFDATDPLGSLQSMAGDFISDQAEKGAKSWMGMEDGKPVLTIMSEVKAANMTAERASRFEVPAGFKIIDRQ